MLLSWSSSDASLSHCSLTIRSLHLHRLIVYAVAFDEFPNSLKRGEAIECGWRNVSSNEGAQTECESIYASKHGPEAYHRHICWLRIEFNVKWATYVRTDCTIFIGTKIDAPEKWDERLAQTLRFNPIQFIRFRCSSARFSSVHFDSPIRFHAALCERYFYTFPSPSSSHCFARPLERDSHHSRHSRHSRHTNQIHLKIEIKLNRQCAEWSALGAWDCRGNVEHNVEEKSK